MRQSQVNAALKVEQTPLKRDLEKLVRIIQSRPNELRGPYKVQLPLSSVKNK
jgi:hypothetical protein